MPKDVLPSNDGDNDDGDDVDDDVDSNKQRLASMGYPSSLTLAQGQGAHRAHNSPRLMGRSQAITVGMMILSQWV